MNLAHLDTAALEALAKFLQAMKKAQADFTGPMQNTTQLRNLIEYLEMGCPKVNGNGEVLTPQLPSGEELCRLILGDDFITPEELSKAYGWSYSDEQMEHFVASLPNFEMLMWLRANGYLLVARPSTEMNFLEVRELDNKLFYSKTKGWYVNTKQNFSRNDKVVAGEWLAVRKGAMPNSFSKTWDEQQDLLTEVEYVPNAAEVSYSLTVYFKVRGVYLLRGQYVRTSSVDADGNRVVVGDFDESGLVVGSFWDHNRLGHLGVTSAPRK